MDFLCFAVIPASAIQLTSGGGVVTASSSSQDGGLPTLTMSSAGSPQGTTIVQYQGQDGQFFVPGKLVPILSEIHTHTGICLHDF